MHRRTIKRKESRSAIAWRVNNLHLPFSFMRKKRPREDEPCLVSKKKRKKQDETAHLLSWFSVYRSSVHVVSCFQIEMKTTTVDGETSINRGEISWGSRKWPRYLPSGRPFPFFLTWDLLPLVREHTFQKKKEVFSREGEEETERSGDRRVVSFIHEPAVSLFSRGLFPLPRLLTTAQFPSLCCRLKPVEESHESVSWVQISLKWLKPEICNSRNRDSWERSAQLSTPWRLNALEGEQLVTAIRLKSFPFLHGISILMS